MIWNYSNTLVLSVEKKYLIGLKLIVKNITKS